MVPSIRTRDHLTIIPFSSTALVGKCTGRTGGPCGVGWSHAGCGSVAPPGVLDEEACMKVISVVALAGALTLGLNQSASASTTLVSGPSPFAGCAIGGPGTVYV